MPGHLFADRPGGLPAQYEQLTKKLVTPAEFTVATRLRFENLEARAITRADLTDDVHGINAIAVMARMRAFRAGRGGESAPQDACRGMEAGSTGVAERRPVRRPQG